MLACFYSRLEFLEPIKYHWQPTASFFPPYLFFLFSCLSVYLFINNLVRSDSFWCIFFKLSFYTSVGLLLFEHFLHKHVGKSILVEEDFLEVFKSLVEARNFSQSWLFGLLR